MTNTATQLAPMLDLDTWRKRESLSWSAVAELINAADPQGPAVTMQTVRKYGIGQLWPDPDVIDRIERITGGEVTVWSLHQRRAAWLRTSGRPRRVVVSPE
jgi:hypothetical protein